MTEKKRSHRTPSPEQMTRRLRDFIAAQESISSDQVRIDNLKRLAGGSSRLLWSLDVELCGGARVGKYELVLRQDPPGRILEGGMALEFELLQAAGKSGVPVPRVYWCDPASECLGAPFFAMDRLAGEAIPRRLLRDERYREARGRLCEQLAGTLARIHAIDPQSWQLAGRLQAPGEDVAAGEIQRLVDGYRGMAVEPHPILDLAERWLRAHRPAGGASRLVHGDYRVGNFMFDERGLVAILDWELAHLGDPVEDLAWLCVRAWRFGNDDQPAGGLGSREQFVAAYEAAGGASVDLEALRFWEVLGNFKLALVFITQARAYLDGAHKTVELASLGRRIAEPEAELLALMEGEA